jgi:GAF domain-containing protein
VHIPFTRGICGAAARSGETQLAPDISAVPYHIASSTLSRSEIVLPIKNAADQVVAILNIDSSKLAAFDHDDQEGLEWICKLLGRFYD